MEVTLATAHVLVLMKGCLVGLVPRITELPTIILVIMVIMEAIPQQVATSITCQVRLGLMAQLQDL